ncbi:HNH endonuclease signature motif containing protein [Paraburkholderia graminis]
MTRKNTEPLGDYLKNRIAVGDTECWEWTASRNKGGYGQAICWLKTHGTILAHRLSYIHFKGPIPVGHDICHTCDNPSCINPDHLWDGTPKENMRDMIRKGRSGKRKGHGAVPEEKYGEIKQKYASGVSIGKLAAEYGVKYDAIFYVCVTLDKRAKESSVS